MGKKRRKRLKKQNSLKKEETRSSVIQSSIYKSDKCSHPLYLKIGGRKVLLLSWTDYYPQVQGKEVKELDIFFGLSSSWEKQEVLRGVKRYSNPVLQRIHTGRKREKAVDLIDNIMMLEIPDRKIDLEVYDTINSAFKEGLNIGFGCFAGHGRTGWVASKMLKEHDNLSGDKAVKRVRKKFCEECVESPDQIKDLGCKKIKASDLNVSLYAQAEPWYQSCASQNALETNAEEEIRSDKAVYERRDANPCIVQDAKTSIVFIEFVYCYNYPTEQYWAYLCDKCKDTYEVKINSLLDEPEERQCGVLGCNNQTAQTYDFDGINLQSVSVFETDNKNSPEMMDLLSQDTIKNYGGNLDD